MPFPVPPSVVNAVIELYAKIYDLLASNDPNFRESMRDFIIGELLKKAHAALAAGAMGARAGFLFKIRQATERPVTAQPPPASSKAEKAQLAFEYYQQVMAFIRCDVLLGVFSVFGGGSGKPGWGPPGGWFPPPVPQPPRPPGSEPDGPGGGRQKPAPGSPPQPGPDNPSFLNPLPIHYGESIVRLFDVARAPGVGVPGRNNAEITESVMEFLRMPMMELP